MAIDQSKLQNFLGKFVGDLGGVTTIAMVALANELGLYRAMDGKGPLDATELAVATGCNRRLIQEWLDQQAAAGYVTFDKSSGRYELPASTGLLSRRHNRRRTSLAARSWRRRCFLISIASSRRFAATAEYRGAITIRICFAAQPSSFGPVTSRT